MFCVFAGYLDVRINCIFEEIRKQNANAKATTTQIITTKKSTRYLAIFNLFNSFEYHYFPLNTDRSID